MGLVDDLIQNIGKEVSRVQERGQELMQAYNLGQEIRALERQKTTKLMEIGRSVYDKYARQINVSDESLIEKCKEITAIENDIAHLQAQLDNLKVQSDPKTPASQRADAKAGFNPTPGYTCPSCNAPASREKSFCPTCGHSVKGTAGEDIVDV